MIYPGTSKGKELTIKIIAHVIFPHYQLLMRLSPIQKSPNILIISWAFDFAPCFIIIRPVVTLIEAKQEPIIKISPKRGHLETRLCGKKYYNKKE